MDPALQELIETGEASEDVAIVVRMRETGAPPPGLRIVSRFGPIATGRIARSGITQIYGHPALLSVKAPRWLASEYGPIIEAADAEDLELRDSDQRRPPGMAQRGKGSIIGIIDWGCDFAHPDFLTNDGRTRFLAIWDQRTTRHDGNRFGYGRIHRAADIQAALAAPDPYRKLDYHPAVSDTGIGAHGTHVMSIAAGNGRGGGPEGVAPEASLLFVHLGVPGWDRAGPLGDSSNLLEALDFMVEMAGDRPLAVNMSLGRHGGPHDGSTLVELAIDWLLTERPGLAIVQSAGNYFGRDAHSAGRLRSDTSIALPFHVNPGDTSPNEVEVWYRGCDVMSAKLIAPSGSVAAEAALASKCPVMAGEQRSGTLYHRIADPNNGDNHIHLFQYPNSQPGEWQLVLTGVDISDGRFNSWIERDPGCRSCQAQFDRAHAETTGTTGSIAHSLRSLVVGAYDHHASEPMLAPFSSSGPTRDGRVRPLFLAPGVKVLAARSQSRRGDAPLLTRMSGTSMASPHVAGTCALLFEAAGPVSAARLRTVLLDSLIPFTADDARDRDRTGFGLLDIEAALAAILGKPVPQSSPSESVETEETAMSCIPGKTCCGRCQGLDVECDAEKRGAGYGLCCTRREAGASGAAVKKCCGACNKAKRAAVLIEAAIPAESAIHPVDAAESVFLTSPADAAEFLSAALAGAGRRWPEGATAASLFDAMLGRLGGERQADYARHFGIIARPGAALGVPIAAGDVLIRRGDGGFAHAALIAHPHLLAADQARAQGLVLEGPWPGQYVQIIEQGHRPHRTSAKFARRLCGADGRVLGDTLILRPLPFSEATEAAEASATDASNMRWLQSSLNQVINAGLTVDGRDGPATRAAIRRFQKSRNLTADGIAGERTRAALRAALGEGPQPVSPPPGGIVVDGTTCRILDRFGFDSATLTPAHNAVIAELARAIAAANVHAITVTGHASPEGPDDHNLALGQRRADNVAAALRTAIDQQRAGATAQIAFAVTSRGEAQPIGTDGPANRRAEVCFREEPKVLPPPRPRPPHANCLLPAQGLRLRPDVDTPEGRRMLTRYERAVGLMKAAAEGPPHNWTFQWYTHNVRADRTKAAEIGRVYGSSGGFRSLANEMWDTCAAHFGRDPQFFLPWHRMYVEFLEQLCRGVLGDNDFMLPYWNYSKGGSSRSLPAPFRNSRSPLFHARRANDPGHDVNGGDPIDSVAGLDPDPHLRETRFLPGPNNVPNGFSRGLDRGLHGNVHTRIGIFPPNLQPNQPIPPTFDTGMGSVPWAANDPIFWMHHCNIDRLWASWNRGGGRNPTDQAWLDQTFIFADRNDRRVVARTGDFVSTDARGYSYDCLEPIPGATLLAGESEDEMESTEPAIAANAGREGRRGIALGSGPTRVRLGAGEASEAVLGETITPRSGKRLYLVLRNYRAEGPPGVVYRVYLELPAHATPEIARRHYVGTFNFFDAVPHHAGAEVRGQTFSFDITDLAERLAPHGGISRTPNVTIVPAGRPIESARPMIGEISIVER